MGTRLGFLAQALPATAAADRSAQSAQHVVMGLSFAPRAEISEFFPAATCIFAPALLLCGGLIVYSFLGDQHDAAASAKLLHYDLLLYAVHAFYTLMYAVELSHADWDLVALVLLICGRRVVFQVSRASVRWPAQPASASVSR